MGFCPKLNLFWHNKHNGLQKFYDYWALFFIFHFPDIFNVFIIGNNFFSFNLFSENELNYWSLEVMRIYCKDWRKTLGMWNNRKSRELIGEWSYYSVAVWTDRQTVPRTFVRDATLAPHRWWTWINCLIRYLQCLHGYLRALRLVLCL